MPKNEKTSPKAYWMGVVVIALLLFACYVYTWRNAYNFRTAIDLCRKPFCDFATYYYPMGESIFHTRQPVTGFVYSPFIALLFALFSPLGLKTSLILWGILQGVFIFLYRALFRRLVPTGQRIQLPFVFLALSSFPLLHNLAWGQVGIITTVFILGALFCYERGQHVLAAILLAFGISFKFFPLIFLLPFVIRRDFRFLLSSFIACGVFLFVVPASFLGMDGATRFYAALFESYRHFGWVLTSYNSQHFPHVILRLAETLGSNAQPYLPLFRWIGYGLAAVNVGFLYLIQRACLPFANLWSFHILFLTIPFVLLTSWPSDLIYISFAQGLLAWQLLEEKKNLHAMRISAFILLAVSIIISNILFFNFLFFNIIANYQSYGFYGAVFWSNLLLLTVSYIQLLPTALQVRV
jgi:hypothetical protein